ncbi:MAG: DNA-formamidopyrimidine glycosylase [Thermodesulfobacteriota bacterium]
MPELPEVQTIVDDLSTAGIVNAPIQQVEVRWPKSIAGVSPDVFCERLTDIHIRGVSRRGKYILFFLSSGDTLLIHLRMSGRLCLSTVDAPCSKHEHVILTLDHGRQLRFHDTRKFGRWLLTDTPGKVLSRLGPEPLAPDFDVAVLMNALGGRRRILKPLLLDQTVIAGLGNIYTDEALWEAGLHPCRPASTLTRKEIRHLHRGIIKVLAQGLQNRGTTLGEGKANFESVCRSRGRNQNALKVFGRQGLPCPRCRTIIQRLLVCQRGTHVCRKCQPLPTEG